MIRPFTQSEIKTLRKMIRAYKEEDELCPECNGYCG